MARLLRIVVPVRQSGGAYQSATDVRSGVMGNKGAGDAEFLLGGNSTASAARPYDGTFRSYLRFALNDTIAAYGDPIPNGWDDIAAVERAYYSVWTRSKAGTGGYPRSQSYFDTGSQAKVRIMPLNADPSWGHAADGLVENITGTTQPDAAHWVAGDHAGIGSSDWEGSYKTDEYISPNKDSETQIDAIRHIRYWAPATVDVHDPDFGAAHPPGEANSPHGVVLKTPSEAAGTGSTRWELHSANTPTSKYRPRLILYVRLKNPTPEQPRTIEPTGAVPPDFHFRGTTIPPDLASPIVSVDIKVRAQVGGAKVWPSEDDVETAFTFPRTVAWPDGEFRVANPRQPDLDPGTAYEWAFRTTTGAGKSSPFSAWRSFTITHESPTVDPVPAGEVETSEGLRFSAALTIAGQAAFVGGYEIELAPRLPAGSPLWRSPVWRHRGMPVETDTEPGDDE